MAQDKQTEIESTTGASSAESAVLTDGLEPFSPKGGMCVTCTKKLHFCNDLPFRTMPALITLDNGVTIVKCTEHVRANETELTGAR